VRRGLAGVQLVVSDAHEGLKQAIAQVLSAPWQRCTVHFLSVNRPLEAFVEEVA
jgi:putative transposase